MDYLELALLRNVVPNHKLGVAWWHYPYESQNSDGRHIGYLSDGNTWRHYDPEVFDHLSVVVKKDRHVVGLESAGFLGGSLFASEVIPKGIQDRQLWVHRTVEAFADRDVVFFDPDNGLEPTTFKLGTLKSGKSISVQEIKQFKREDRTLIVYHHQTRFKGGHAAEIRYWASRLADDFKTVDAIRCRPWTARVYFLLDASAEIWLKSQSLCERWGNRMQWNPHSPECA